MSYYTVHIGRTPGIYNTWNECKEEVEGLEYSEYKKFSDKDKAEDFLKFGRKGKEATIVNTSSSKKSKKVYYVVHKGKLPGIYNSWDECKLQVKGFKKPIF